MGATSTVPLAESTYDSSVTEEKVVEAVECIVAKANPLRVVAFGSRARGTHRQDSDLDLAVMVEDEAATGRERAIWRTDIPLDMSVDLLVFGRSRHEFMKDSIISVHFDIANEGVVLYDAGVGSIDRGAVARIAR